MHEKYVFRLLHLSLTYLFIPICLCILNVFLYFSFSHSEILIHFYVFHSKRKFHLHQPAYSSTMNEKIYYGNIMFSLLFVVVIVLVIFFVAHVCIRIFNRKKKIENKTQNMMLVQFPYECNPCKMPLFTRNTTAHVSFCSFCYFIFKFVIVLFFNFFSLSLSRSTRTHKCYFPVDEFHLYSMYVYYIFLPCEKVYSYNLI